MRFAIVVLLGVLALATARQAVVQTFQDYVQQYNKPYAAGSEEYAVREAIFNANLHAINHHNLNSGATWSVEVNQFTDLNEEEFKNKIRGFNKRVSRAHKSATALSQTRRKFRVEELPKEVDWRTKGVVTPVKDQGGCGSCWAFSTVETFESHLAITTGILSELSEQQLVTCVANPDECGGTGGCDGATMTLGFEYIAANGLTDEWHYPYTSYKGSNATCPNAITPLYGSTGLVNLPSNDDAALLEAVATQGPIAITVDASSWASYRGGVFDGCNEVNPDLNHGVQLVGYGTDNKTGVPYWLVRNSWGPSWGEKGYIRIKRNPGAETCGVDLKPQDGSGCKDGPATVKVCGTCGILYDSSYPTGTFKH